MPRLAIGVIILLGALILALAVEAARDRLLRSAAPGLLVNLRGRRVHLYCSGEGGRTVVIKAGAGNWSIDWLSMVDSLAKSIRVCVVDRAGYVTMTTPTGIST
jgi:hypothetical protein